MRHHKKEKAFGPSPNNGYTAGSPRRKFWQRKPKQNRDMEYMAGAKDPNALPMHATPADVRTSYATDATAVNDGVAAPGTGVAGHGYQTTTTSRYGNGNF